MCFRGGPRMRWIGAISRRKVSAPPQQSQVKTLGSGSFGAGSPSSPSLSRMKSRVRRARGEVSERGWNTKYNSVAKILIEGERRHTDRMQQQLILIGDIFLQVTRNYKKTVSLVARNAPQSEIDSTVRIEKNMVGQLLTAVQSINTDASALSESATSKARTSQAFSNRTNIILLITIATVITSTSVLIVRSVYRPLEELTKGTEVIGSGNLKFRTGIDSRDEFGLLSQAFDEMAERLNLTTVSRDELVEVRWTVRHFRQVTIQDIDEVPQNELLRLGVSAAAEDDYYDNSELPWRGCTRHLFTAHMPSN